MNHIKNFLIELRYSIIEIIALKMVNFRLNMAIRKANILCKINNTIYYVIPKPPRLKGGRKDFLMCITRNDLIRMKKMQIIPKGMGHVEVAQQWEFYRTPKNRTGADAISFEERMKLRDKYIAFQRITNPIFKLLNR